MNSDAGHRETDALLADLEKRIAKEYAQAVRDTQAKLDDYLRRFEIKDEKWRLMVANGEKTKKEYQEWRKGQIMVEDIKRAQNKKLRSDWEILREDLAKDYHKANVNCKKMGDKTNQEVYALNHNYATFEVEKGALVDTSYTLYDRQTVERIMRDNPDLLPPPGRNMKARIAAGKDIRWQEGQIQSVTLQSILQGESIPNMAKRIAREMGETNHASTIRYARTAVTGAQNAGRQDAYKRAEALGVDMQRKWIATLDNRTRHEHRILDGQIRGIDEPFETDGEQIMYPGDPSAAPHMTWNCRCTTRAVVKGWESKTAGLRSYAAIEGQSYEEWKKGHSQSRKITAQEEAGEAARRSFVSMYRRAGKK